MLVRLRGAPPLAAPLHLALIVICLVWLSPDRRPSGSSFRPPAVSTSGWWTAFCAAASLHPRELPEVLTSNNMGQSFVNSLFIAVPATVIPLLIAAFAAYAFAWMELPAAGTGCSSCVVGLLVVPLQMTLIPVLRLFTAARARRHVSRHLAGAQRLTACPLPSSCCGTSSAACRATCSNPPTSTAPPLDALLSPRPAAVGAGLGLAGDLPVPLGVERPAGRAHLPGRRPERRAADGHVQPGQLARAGLAAAHRRRLHLDGAAAGVFFALQRYFVEASWPAP